MLAISKCDIPPYSEEGEILPIPSAEELTVKLGIPVVHISSFTGEGIDRLKDMLWDELTKEQNQVIEISHAPIDIKLVEREEEPQPADEEEEGTIYLNEVEEEWDLNKYKGIGWDE